MGKLTTKAIAGLTEPGRYSDGDGLMLVVDSGGRRYWYFRYTHSGRRRDLSLGAERLLSLRDARELAMAARLKLRQGIDPVEERHSEAKDNISFADAAERAHRARLASWSNGKHQDQWISTLRTHVFPVFGRKPVAEVTRSDVVAALAPIWLKLPETARRVKQRIEAVIDWAVGEDIREDGINFKLVTRALPRQTDEVTHMKAVHYTDVPAFMKTLAMAKASSKVRAAIELTVLTASRPGNIRFMTWDEIDFDSATWRIPADKMKMRRDHVVPLPPRAIELLDFAKGWRKDKSPYVFPGDRGLGPISDNTKTSAIKAMGYAATAHGFRSSFKDWSRAARWEDYLSEFQLAHVDSNQSRAPYGRDGQLALRRAMMEDWAAFVVGEAEPPIVEPVEARRERPATAAANSNVVPLRSPKATPGRRRN